MRRSKELIVLVVLLLGTVAFVMWYVIDRRARQHAQPAAEPRMVGPVAPEKSAPPSLRGTAPEPEAVDLEKVTGKTVDMSRGRPVIKDTPEDRAAMDSALKEMEEAARDVTFDTPKKEPPRR